MSRNRCHINAPPKRVFGVLADPRSYAYWVVGSKRIRHFDPAWPAPGSSFHHAVGVGPLKIRDHTLVEAVDPPRMIQLKAKARPLGTARVVVELRRRGRGTEVTLTELPGDRLTARLINPLTNGLIHGRNAWSLDRLRDMAEGRVRLPDEAAPTRWSFRRVRPGPDRSR